MGTETSLMDSVPTDLRWDRASNLVRWKEHANGTTIHRAMPEPLFRQTAMMCMTLVRRIDKERSSSSAEESAAEATKVVPFGRRGK